MSDEQKNERNLCVERNLGKMAKSVKYNERILGSNCLNLRMQIGIVVVAWYCGEVSPIALFTYTLRAKKIRHARKAGVNPPREIFSAISGGILEVNTIIFRRKPIMEFYGSVGKTASHIYGFEQRKCDPLISGTGVHGQSLSYVSNCSILDI